MTVQPPEFSQRDWDTGWIFPEVRAYAWKLDPEAKYKHAMNPESRTYDAMCGSELYLGVWLETREARIAAFSMPRCMECLKLIGAPMDHPYSFSAPEIRSRKRHAPTVQGHSPFNAGIDPSNPNRPTPTGKVRNPDYNRAANLPPPARKVTERMISDIISADPSISNRELAARLDVSDVTVGKIRREHGIKSQAPSRWGQRKEA